MGQELNSVNLSLDFLSVCEAAAIASARTMGQGDRKYSDHVAVDAMRQQMDAVPMRGRIVIGEGERDEAPMLYIDEEVGAGFRVAPELRDEYPEVDIAVDPLEGTNLCALGANNAIAVLAASERGGLLNAPDIYMDKIVVGPSSRGAIDIDAPVKDNLKAIARRLGRDIEDLTVIVLDRSRHKKLIQDVRDAGARIRLIGDGDLSAGISAAVAGTNIHALIGIGGAPEGYSPPPPMNFLTARYWRRLRPGASAWDKAISARCEVPPRSAARWASNDPNKIRQQRPRRPQKNHFSATGSRRRVLGASFRRGQATHSYHDQRVAPHPLCGHRPRRGRPRHGH